MQTRKFSLQNFKGGRPLSREEMKNVLGGLLAPVGVGGSDTCADAPSCKVDTDCDGFCDYCISGKCGQKKD